MSFGTFGELKKIQTLAKINTDLQIHGLLLALQLPTGNPETDRQWLDLLNAAKDLGFNVAGVSFETAMTTDKSKAKKGHFNKMMALTKMAFTIGCSLGHSMKVLFKLLVCFCCRKLNLERRGAFNKLLRSASVPLCLLRD